MAGEDGETSEDLDKFVPPTGGEDYLRGQGVEVSKTPLTSKFNAAAVLREDADEDLGYIKAGKLVDNTKPLDWVSKTPGVEMKDQEKTDKS